MIFKTQTYFSLGVPTIQENAQIVYELKIADTFDAIELDWGYQGTWYIKGKQIRMLLTKDYVEKRTVEAIWKEQIYDNITEELRKLNGLEGEKEVKAESEV